MQTHNHWGSSQKPVTIAVAWWPNAQPYVNILNHPLQGSEKIFKEKGGKNIRSRKRWGSVQQFSLNWNIFSKRGEWGWGHKAREVNKILCLGQLRLATFRRATLHLNIPWGVDWPAELLRGDLLDLQAAQSSRDTAFLNCHPCWVGFPWCRCFWVILTLVGNSSPRLLLVTPLKTHCFTKCNLFGLLWALFWGLCVCVCVYVQMP